MGTGKGGFILLICTGLLFLLLTQSAQAFSLPEYTSTFIAFTRSLNPMIPVLEAKKLAEYNWNVTDGNWQMARRLAAMENVESGHFKMAAWIEDKQPPKIMYPRYDALGSHIVLLAQESRKLGLLPKGVTNPYGDEMEPLLDKLAKDPAYGTWIIAHAYVRKARKVGLERASRWWQTGKSWFKDRKDYQNDSYLKMIHSSEQYFDKMKLGVPLTEAPNKSRRKR